MLVIDFTEAKLENVNSLISFNVGLGAQIGLLNVKSWYKTISLLRWMTFWQFNILHSKKAGMRADEQGTEWFLPFENWR